MKTSKRVASVLGWCGLIAVAACTVEVEDEEVIEEENVGEVQQAYDGQSCAFHSDCSLYPDETCCGGFPPYATGTCHNLQTDNDNCGSCGNECPGGFPFFTYCSEGHCCGVGLHWEEEQCPHTGGGACCADGYISCDNVCRDEATGCKGYCPPQ